MPDFMIRAVDYTDEGAAARRAQVRMAHLASVASAVAAGHFFYGAAVLDEAGKPCGSLMCGRFADRAELEAWLAREPFVTDKVWEHIEVRELKPGPSFIVEDDAI